MIKKLSLIFLYIVCVSIAQILLKIAMSNMNGMKINVDFFSSSIRDYKVILGMFLYGMSFILWMIILSRMEITFAYPLLSISVIVVSIVAWIFFDESFSIMRLFGIILTITGAWLVVKS